MESLFPLSPPGGVISFDTTVVLGGTNDIKDLRKQHTRLLADNTTFFYYVGRSRGGEGTPHGLVRGP